MYPGEVAGEQTLLLQQLAADPALPGLVPVRGLVGLPALVVHEGHEAEVACVAVLQPRRLRLQYNRFYRKENFSIKASTINIIKAQKLRFDFNAVF